MKLKQNFIATFLILFFAFTFVQCSDNDTTEETNVTTSSTVVVTVIEDTTAPVFITEPQITEVTSDSVNISWLVEDDFGSPEVQISLNDKVIYKGRDTQYQITDLQPNTSYQLVIIATDLNNNLTTKTFTVTTKPLLDIEPPRFTKALTLDNVTYNSATISWEVEDLLSEFVLVLLINNEEIDEFQSPFELTGLQPNTKYTVSLTAIDSSNNESLNTLGFQTPQDPSITQTSINFLSPLKVSEITSSSGTASWKVQNQTGEVIYTLFIGDEIIYSGKDSSYQLTDLSPDSYYELDLDLNFIKGFSMLAVAYGF